MKDYKLSEIEHSKLVEKIDNLIAKAEFCGLSTGATANKIKETIREVVREKLGLSEEYEPEYYEKQTTEVIESIKGLGRYAPIIVDAKVFCEKYSKYVSRVLTYMVGYIQPTYMGIVLKPELHRFFGNINNLFYNIDCENELAKANKIYAADVAKAYKGITDMKPVEDYKVQIDDKVYKIDDIQFLLNIIDTTSVMSMNGTFQKIERHQGLDISNLNTPNVLIMDYCFRDCKTDIIGLNKIKTGKVNSITGMFQRYKGHVVDLSNFYARGLTDMGKAFKECEVDVLDLRNFRVSKKNLIAKYEAFYGCKGKIIVDRDNVDILKSLEVAEENVGKTFHVEKV